MANKSLGQLQKEYDLEGFSLARLETESKEILATYDERIAGCEANGLKRLAADVKAERDSRALLFERCLARAQVRLAGKRSDLAQENAIVLEAQESRAAEAEGRAKRLARVTFAARGGDPSAFEAEWPAVWRGIQRELIERRAAGPMVLPERL